MHRLAILTALAFHLGACTIINSTAVFGDPRDSGADVDGDSGPDDAGFDSGADVPLTPTLRWPPNGYRSGSIHAPAGALTNHPLRPRVMWEPVEGADEYELQFDDSCTSIDECTFPSPEVDERVPGENAPAGTALFARPPSLPVSDVAPVGRRYFWRVRACSTIDGCGPWSSTRYLDVGRLANDFDGNGFGDLAVGAPGHDLPPEDVGAVFVYLGTSTGFPTTPETTLISPSPEEFDSFGMSITEGDFDGDGFADLAVGTTRRDRVYVYYGEAAGLPTSPSLTLSNPVGDLADFGVTVASGGDLDGDGFADLAIAAPGEVVGGTRATVFVYRGGESGLEVAPTWMFETPVIESGTLFGGTLSVGGDIDGDGLVDLAVGAPLGAGGDGFVVVYPSTATGPDTDRRRLIDNPATTQRGFGRPLTSEGDINGDGLADLVTRARSFDGSDNRILVYEGTSRGINALPDTTLSGPNLGTSLALAGDLDSDGFSDLVVGARGAGASAGEGAALVYYGAADGLPAAANLVLDNPTAQGDSLFGTAVGTSGDVNGDGYADLAVGAPFYDDPEPNEGAAFVYFGDVGGVPSTPSVSLDNPTDQIDGNFGGTLVGR